VFSLARHFAARQSPIKHRWVADRKDSLQIRARATPPHPARNSFAASINQSYSQRAEERRT
jgi:hypothetical protein